MKGSGYNLCPIQIVPDTVCSRYNMFPIQFVPDTICSRYNLCRYILCRYKLCRYNLCRYNLYMNPFYSLSVGTGFQSNSYQCSYLAPACCCPHCCWNNAAAAVGCCSTRSASAASCCSALASFLPVGRWILPYRRHRRYLPVGPGAADTAAHHCCPYSDSTAPAAVVSC